MLYLSMLIGILSSSSWWQTCATVRNYTFEDDCMENYLYAYWLNIYIAPVSLTWYRNLTLCVKTYFRRKVFKVSDC